MLKRFSTNFALFSLVLDLGLTGTALGLAQYLRDLLSWGKPLGNETNTSWTLYGIIAAIWFTVFVVLSVYDPKRTYKVVDEFQAVLVANSFALLIFAGTLYLSFREISRLLFIYFAVLSTFLLLSWRVIARVVFRLANGHSLPEQRVIIAGAGTWSTIRSLSCSSWRRRSVCAGIRSSRRRFPLRSPSVCLIWSSYCLVL